MWIFARAVRYVDDDDAMTWVFVRIVRAIAGVVGTSRRRRTRRDWIDLIDAMHRDAHSSGFCEYFCMGK